MTTLTPELYRIFELINFSQTEAIIYLTALELGSASIWDIAKNSMVKRPTCYAILDQLVAQGYATKTYDGRRQRYTVTTPKELLARLEQKNAEFASSLVYLESIASQATTKPRIRLYEGLEGVKQVYLSELTYRDTELLIYGTNEVLQTMADFFTYFVSERVKRNIRARLILAKTADNIASTRDDAEYLRESRFFSKKDFNPLEDVNVIGDTIIYIAHTEKEPFATAIESASFARHEREKFNLLWEIAKPR